jgi:hypothetical protein
MVAPLVTPLIRAEKAALNALYLNVADNDLVARIDKALAAGADAAPAATEQAKEPEPATAGV